MARRRQPAASALDSLNAVASPETESHLDDPKVVNTQPAQQATDVLPQRFIDAQCLSSGWKRRVSSRAADGPRAPDALADAVALVDGEAA